MTENATRRRGRVMSALIAVALLLGLSTPPVRGQDEAAMKDFMTKLTPAYVKSMTGKSDPSNDAIKELMKDRLKANKYLKDHEPNDTKLKVLLLTTFEADWAKAKQCLLFEDWPVAGTKPSHNESLALMGELVKMRSRECKRIAYDMQDATMKYLKVTQFPALKTYLAQVGMEKEFSLELVKFNDAQKQFNMLAPTGAEKRTSDIDVASNGLNTEIGVRLFNQTFRHKLGVQWDPATVFDYNVYAADWIFPSGFLSHAISQTETELTPKPEHVLERDCGAAAARDIALQVERAIILGKAGLLHIRRNCTEKEWNAYMTSRKTEGDKVLTVLQVVDNQYKTFEAEIKSRRNTISIAKSGSAWGKKNDHYFDEAVETLARNQIYQDRLLRVKGFRLHYRVLKEKAKKTGQDREQMFTLAKQMTQAIAEALYFANEVYATEGATLHATQAIQAVATAQKRGITLRVHLSPEHYKQSFHENVGDALHSLKHYKDDPAYAEYRAGKYVERMILAGRAILGEAKKGDLLQHRNFALLNDLGLKAAKIKASNTAGDDPAIIKMNFKSANAKDLEKLIHAILDVDAHVAGKAGH